MNSTSMKIHRKLLLSVSFAPIPGIFCQSPPDTLVFLLHSREHVQKTSLTRRKGTGWHCVSEETIPWGELRNCVSDRFSWFATIPMHIAAQVNRLMLVGSSSAATRKLREWVGANVRVWEGRFAASPWAGGNNGAAFCIWSAVSSVVAPQNLSWTHFGVT